MKEPINESQVEQAYEAVFDCLRLVEEHFVRCVNLFNAYKAGSAVEVIPLKGEEVRGIGAGLRALRDAMSPAERLLEALKWELPALADGPVLSTGIAASSWAKATVMVAGLYAKDGSEWEQFTDLDKRRQHALFDRVTTLMPNVPLFKANLEIEAARLRERALAMSSDVRFGYVLRKLSPQPRKLMELLIRRQGRLIDYQEVGEAVWGDSRAKEPMIHRVMSRLRSELESFGLGEIGRDIRSESGAYRFR